MGIYKGQFKANREVDNCGGILFCTFCGKAVPCQNVEKRERILYPEEVENEQGEQDSMIPRGNSSPSNGKGKKKASGFRYLSADMLTSTHQLATIQDARMQPDNFNPNSPDVLVVKLKFKGEFILWTLRANNPSLEELGDAFGDDETKWNGKEIELFIEEDNFTGKKWIRSEAVTETRKSKSR